MKEKSNVVGFGTKVKSFFKFLFCVVGSGTVAFCCAALAFQEFGSTKTNIILWIVAAVFGIIFFIERNSHKKKCPKCWKWNALVKDAEELVSKEDVIIDKKEQVGTAGWLSKDQIIYKNKKVGGIKKTYNYHKTCKYCGTGFVDKRSVIREK